MRCLIIFFKVLFFIFILKLILVLNLFNIFNIVFSDDIENTYTKATEKAWKKYPILDISLTRKFGYKEIILMDFKDIDLFCDCSHIEEFLLVYNEECTDYKLEVGCNEYNPKNKASRLYGTKIYVSYYEADYLTLISRLRNDMGELNNQLCKDGFKRCGYLDIFKNIFCVKEEEICPINELTFKLNNGSIVDIITNNTRKDLYIINQLIVSEIENPSIFDINKFYTLNDKKNNKKDYIYGQEYFRLTPLKIPNKITKSSFFEQNELMKGKTPTWFNNEFVNLYHMIYPGINIEYPLYFFSLLKRSFPKILQYILISCKILFIPLLFFYVRKPTKISLIANIILIIIFFAFIIINCFQLIGKYHLIKTLELYSKTFSFLYFGSSDFFRDIFSIIFDIIVLIFYCSLLYKKFNNKNNNDNHQLLNNE